MGGDQLGNGDRRELGVHWWAGADGPHSTEEIPGEVSVGITRVSASIPDATGVGVDLYQIVVDYLDDESVSDYFFASSSSPSVCLKNDVVKATDSIVQDSDIETFLNR